MVVGYGNLRIERTDNIRTRSKFKYAQVVELCSFHEIHTVLKLRTSQPSPKTAGKSCTDNVLAGSVILEDHSVPGCSNLTDFDLSISLLKMTMRVVRLRQIIEWSPRLLQ